MWGVFQTENEIHVAPCDDDGFTDHDISQDCPCNPSFMRDGIIQTVKTLWSHNEPS